MTADEFNRIQALEHHPQLWGTEPMQPTTKLIGIVGHAGSGKSSLTEKARNQWNGIRHCEQIGFADPMYLMLEAMGVPRDVLYDKSRWNEPLDVLNGHSLRFAMTTLGTEWGRTHLGSDIWVNLTMLRVKEFRAAGKHVIVDNCRFPSEFDALEAAGATMIGMHRAGLEINTTHESEQHIEALHARCHCHLDNDGTFDDGVIKMHETLNAIIAN